MLVVFLALTPVWFSLGSALANPGLGPSVSSRFAEWLRDNGGRSVVVFFENWWYQHHQPAAGGRPPAGAIPPPTTASATTTTSPSPSKPSHRRVPSIVPLPTPAPLSPLANGAVPGEGQWHAAGRTVGGQPAIYEAFLRPDNVYTRLVAGVAWMDMRLLRATLYLGSYIPGGGPFKYTAPIEPAAAKTLVALFNSGFRMQDTNGGYYTDGRLLYPMRTGAASFVIYRDGSVNIGTWGTEVKMTPQVVAARHSSVFTITSTSSADASITGDVCPGG